MNYKAPVVLMTLAVAVLVMGARPEQTAPAKNVAARLSFPYEQGWLGADDAYSVPIGQGKSVWLFGDTFAGDVANRDRNKTTMVRNSVGVTTCMADKPCTIQYFWKNQKKSPELAGRSFRMPLPCRINGRFPSRT